MVMPCKEEYVSSIKVTMSISTDTESDTRYIIEVVMGKQTSKWQIEHISTFVRCLFVTRMSQMSPACENIFQ